MGRKRIRLRRQRDAMDCGPASLAMIVSYYGREPDIDRLRDLCALGKTGVSLSLRRDTLGYREAAVRFPCVEVSPLAATTLPCTLTTDAGPYLHYIFGM